MESEFKVAPNIAIIKYWGKANQNLIYPLNSSISFTLDDCDLNTRTKVILSSQEWINDEPDISFSINGSPFPISDRIRSMCISFCQSIPFQSSLNIISHNNFPTASGLASSSSGLSCLALCLDDLHKRIQNDHSDSHDRL